MALSRAARLLIFLVAAGCAGCGGSGEDRSAGRSDSTPTPLPSQLSPAPTPSTPSRASGELDPSFGEGGIVHTSLAGSAALLVQPNGRILLAGAEDDSLFVAAFRSDGGVDDSFAGGVVRIELGETPLFVGHLARLQDGRLLLGGRAGSRPLLVRTDSDGMLDPTFGDGGIALDERAGAPAVADFALDEQGRIVAAGSRDDRAVLARYQANGFPDTSFGEEGIHALPSSNELAQCSVGTVVVQRDGSIVAGGSCFFRPPSIPVLARVSPDGKGEAEALEVAPGVRIVQDMLVRHDERVLLTIADAPSVALYEPSGTPVTTFGNEGLSPYIRGAYIAPLAVDEADRAVAAGYFLDDASEPVPKLAVIRFTANGFLDPTFGVGGLVVTPLGAESQGIGIAVQEDGRILVAGVVDGQLVLLRYFGGG